MFLSRFGNLAAAVGRREIDEQNVRVDFPINMIRKGIVSLFKGSSLTV